MLKGISILLLFIVLFVLFILNIFDKRRIFLNKIADEKYLKDLQLESDMVRYLDELIHTDQFVPISDSTCIDWEDWHSNSIYDSRFPLNQEAIKYLRGRRLRWKKLKEFDASITKADEFRLNMETNKENNL